MRPWKEKPSTGNLSGRWCLGGSLTATAGLSQPCAGGDSSAPEPCAGDADVQGLAPVLEDPRDQWDSGLFGARCSGLGGLCPHRMKEEGLPVSGVRPAYRVTGETRLATMIGGDVGEWDGLKNKAWAPAGGLRMPAEELLWAPFGSAGRGGRVCGPSSQRRFRRGDGTVSRQRRSQDPHCETPLGKMRRACEGWRL